ncbi:MAG: BrnT family toxin [Pyrinomonadaceae bacterium]|nr:BrnT family toxin [Pyrinomonadaceae bacterium]
MEFEWNEGKAKANLAKHEVAFDEAKTVFNDPLFVIFADPDHSSEEKRFVILGESNKGKLLVVAFTERQTKIRLISARKATLTERKNYEQEI